MHVMGGVYGSGSDCACTLMHTRSAGAAGSFLSEVLPCPEPSAHPPHPDEEASFVSLLQATSRRLSLERRTLNPWPHSSATAAPPRPGETWVPSAEVRKERASLTHWRPHPT